ncbi:MAG: HNH endonuclease, partial [Proteobacteria bacterium]|nr:HNH endonuclease [Pseudomonadota bacterium]MBU1581899.1 HNH endonuclease [Pseudomonadota bacterium]
AKPGEGVDHVDGNSKNNSPSNLKKYKLIIIS